MGKIRIGKTVVITTIICLFPIIVGMILYDLLPEQVPIHWRAEDVPDLYCSKNFLVFIIPIIVAVSNIFSYVAINLDPKRGNISKELLRINMCMHPLLAIGIAVFIYLSTFDEAVDVIIFANMFCSLGLILSGNYLYMTKQSYTVGIKSPWALKSEKNWEKTHEMASYLWVYGGGVAFLLSFLKTEIPYVIIVIALLIIAPFIYSYSLHKKGI